jgi:peptidoglycan/LPS O-acetylase OafA/YrhL
LSNVEYLNGLRGFATGMVFFSHFRGGFFPAANNYIFNLFCDGSFAVMIFFVLSGYVLSNSFFSAGKSEKFYYNCCRRYIRLVVPVIFSVFFAYICLRYSLFYNKDILSLTGNEWISGFYNFSPNFYAMLKEGFIGIFAGSAPIYNPVLWTMHTELFGSLIVYALIGVISYLRSFNKYRNRCILYTIVAGILIIYKDPATLAFIFGIFLCDDHHSEDGFIFRDHNTPITITILIIIGLISGSFIQTYLSMSANLSGYIGVLCNQIPGFANNSSLILEYARAAGSALIMIALLKSKRLQSFFSYSPAMFMGKISFSFYTIHLILLCSVASFIYLNFIYLGIFYASIISLIICLPLTCILSYYITEYVDNYGIQISKSIPKKLIWGGQRIKIFIMQHSS